MFTTALCAILILGFFIAVGFWMYYYLQPGGPPKPSRIKKMVDVGAVDVEIHLLHTSQVHTLTIHGRSYLSMGHVNVISARDRFDRWRQRCGETGTVRIDDELFIPLCQVSEIRAIDRSHIVFE